MSLFEIENFKIVMIKQGKSKYWHKDHTKFLKDIWKFYKNEKKSDNIQVGAVIFMRKIYKE